MTNPHSALPNLEMRFTPFFASRSPTSAGSAAPPTPTMSIPCSRASPCSSDSIIWSTYGTDEKYFTSGRPSVEEYNAATPRLLQIFRAVMGTSLPGNSQMRALLVHARKRSAIPPW
ncbi:hypothetical protein M3J09_011269 [Ascochyta lentis]